MRWIFGLLALGLLTACAPQGLQTGETMAPMRPEAQARANREAVLSGIEPNPVSPPVTEQVVQNNRPVITANNPEISDEQDFAAVSERQSIESDRERLDALQAARQEIQPEALPTRPGSTGPNIVAFALSTTNLKGQPVYRRTFASAARAQRACAGFASPDLAQQEFLSRGGPQRDRLGLDPDGDGFACAWDPAPFRLASRG